MLVILGFLLIGVCGGGVGLVLFGVATGLVGGAVALQGGWAVLLPTGILVLTLVAVGVYVLTSTGC